MIRNFLATKSFLCHSQEPAERHKTVFWNISSTRNQLHFCWCLYSQYLVDCIEQKGLPKVLKNNSCSTHKLGNSFCPNSHGPIVVSPTIRFFEKVFFVQINRFFFNKNNVPTKKHPEKILHSYHFNQANFQMQ